MEVGLVRSVDIDQEMQQSYLDYAMSVIVARALPDARDGLKPVHRRILFAMYDMGVRADTSYKKSARIVGEVLGKYHPHGDSAVYDAMSRMAQDFSMRYMLVDGQGNFGSVDGDPPAAMRYTEARLASTAMELLVDIQKGTVDYSENFDGSLQEPNVLPAALPNLLVNGATGIAVGMSTSIPPHNMGEVVDALVYMLDHWEGLDDISVDDLMGFIQGPDFPTGGIILQNSHEEGLSSAYATGRGRVTVQARVHFEEMNRGRNRIIVTELPYMTNKSSLIERIAELAREERLEGIADLRDESDRQGLRIVIELNKNAEPEAVLRDLYKSTPMRSTFSIIMLALVDGEPRMLSLKQALRVYLDHRLVVIKRRAQHDLEKARQRAHILEGLRVALKNLDEVINLIRRSPDAETARERLKKRFKLSELQAQAILDMPLRRLASLERKKIEDEYKELQTTIKDLESLLRTPKRMRKVVSDELGAIKERYNDRRRTAIVMMGENGKNGLLLMPADLTPEKPVWLSLTADGLLSRSHDDSAPRPSGREAPVWLVHASTRDTLYLVTEQGETAAVPVHAVPEAASPASGVLAHKICPLSERDRVAIVFNLPPREERPQGWYVLTATRKGMVKKSDLAELPGPSAKPFTLVRVNEDDSLGWLCLTDGKADVLIATAQGMAIRFSEEEVRPMGLVAAGVGGIKLQKQDEVIGMELAPSKGEVLLVASDGRAKRVRITDFSVQGRYGQGLQAWKLSKNAQLVGLVVGKATTRMTVHLDKLAPKSMRFDEAPVQTRPAQGRSVMDLKSGDRIVALTLPRELPFANPKKRLSSSESSDSSDENGDVSSGGGAGVPASAGKKAKTTPASGARSRTSKPSAKTGRSAGEPPTGKKPPARTASRKTTSKAAGQVAVGEKAAPPPTRRASTRKAAAGPATASARAAAALKTAVEKPPARKPAARKTSAAAKTSTGKGASRSVPSKPAAARTTTPKPAASASKAGTQANKPKSKTAAKKPADSKPAASKPAASKPAAKKPAASKPAAEKTASKGTPTKESPAKPASGSRRTSTKK